MALDFPNAPSVGEQFTSNGRTWIWDGTVWNTVTTAIVSGPTGPAGSNGYVGADGAAGATGPTGPAGSGGSGSTAEIIHSFAMIG